MIERRRPASKRRMNGALGAAVLLGLGAVDRVGLAQVSEPEEPASSSLLARPPAPPAPPAPADAPHALRSVSMFAVEDPEPAVFQKHDLIQIIVRESSLAKRKQELETDKRIRLNGEFTAWPSFRLDQLWELIVKSTRETDPTKLPAIGVDVRNRFDGEGEYERRDEFTARLTAEVLEVLPNGNLILESRTLIKTDEEESLLKVTGVCRPEDVTPANTILSNQLHDLKIEKVHEGELKKANEKGIFTKILDAIFAF